MDDLKKKESKAIREGIRNRLIELRENKHLKQREVAEILDTDLKNYGKYEQGKNIPRIENIILLAKFYNTSTDYILTGKEQKVDECIAEIIQGLPADKQEKALQIFREIVSLTGEP